MLPTRRSPVVGSSVDLVGGDHRTVHQVREEVENVPRIDRQLRVAGVDGGDRFGVLEGERSCEHRQPAEDHAFEVIQQLVAPVDR